MQWLVLLADEAERDIWSKLGAIGPIGAALITAAFGMFLWWLNKKRPNKIQVRESEPRTLLDVPDTLGGRLKAEFDNTPIKTLYETTIDVTNQSAEVITKITLTILLSRKLLYRTPKILYVALSGVEAKATPRTDGDASAIALEIPDLNPYRGHGEQVRLKFICDNLPTYVEVKGRGTGWTVAHFSPAWAKLVKRRNHLVLFWLLIVLAFVLWLVGTLTGVLNSLNSALYFIAVTLWLGILGTSTGIFWYERKTYLNRGKDQ